MAILWFSNETPSRDGQGGQRRQFFQIDALLRDAVDVQVITLAGEQDGTSVSSIADLHRADWWWRGLPVRLGAIVSTDRVVRRRHWSGVVIAHSESWAIGRWIVARTGAPTFVDLHNVHSAWYAAGGDAERSARYERIEREVLNHADTVAVCSPREMERLPHQRDARVVVMGHGIDPAEWTLAPEEPRPVVKMFGNWDWEPNEAGLRWFFQRVWPGVVAEVPGATCEIAGHRGRFSSVDGAIQFHGRVPDLSRFLSDAAAVCVPVRDGVGAPVKYAEALASGVPVVATVDGAQGLELSGVLVSDDAVAWMRTLTEILRNPQAFRAAAGVVRERALTNLDWYAQSAPLRQWARSRALSA